MTAAPTRGTHPVPHRPIGRVLADLALGTPADAEPFPPDAHAVLR
jgi:hypothetical protein